MDKLLIINHLKLLEIQKNLQIEINLEEYKDVYLESKTTYSTLCKKCIEWEKLELPYDCIMKPNYCHKKDEDEEIIKLYERLIK